MPTLSRFYGIVIFINYNDHQPPHFHARYQDQEVLVEIETGIAKDEFVGVIDKNNKKPLAVGIALFAGNEMQKMTSGKVIKNIHYVGDELWRMEV